MALQGNLYSVTFDATIVNFGVMLNIKTSTSSKSSEESWNTLTQ